MQTDYELVVFSDDWNGLPFSCKHLLRHFLPEIPLIWIETIGLRSPKLNIYDIKRSVSKLSQWLIRAHSNFTESPSNLSILNPLLIPYNQYTVIRRFNDWRLIRAVQQAYLGRPKRARIVLTTWPFLAGVIGRLGEQLSIYYRVDDFSEFPGVNKKRIQQLEHELIEKVDMIVASAKKLIHLDSSRRIWKYLPHGVDFEHFSSQEQYLCPRLQSIQPPRIGFFGLLNSWLDFRLLSEVAACHPDWAFVFIGPSQLPASDLPRAPNMHFLGPVSYEQLPSYARYFDVGLIPFKIDSLTTAVNPLKLMEYFALGLPVVSTPLPEVTRYQDYLYIASEPGAFGNAITKALAEHAKNKRRSRQQIAKLNGWEAKSRELQTWIEEVLERKIHNRS